MRTFHILYTGDYLDESGEVAYGDIGLGLYENLPHMEYDFIRDQAPPAGDSTYWSRLYSLQIEPEHIAEANGLIIFRPWLKASAFAGGAENLVVVGRAGAGYDKIDLDACTKNNVAVFNAPDTLTHSTASSALLLMLALAKRLPEQEKMAHSGCWNYQAKIIGLDLEGMTLGIIGLGKTGMELARLVQPFGMRILAYSPHAKKEQAEKLGITLLDQIDTLFRQSDFVSLHNRLEKHNHGFIGEKHFRLMKPTAYFINVARGELVQQEVLVQCLREHWIAGAGLDVYQTEPLPAGDPLMKLDNVILTPHWLPSTRQACYATGSTVARGMIEAAQGRIPEHILNPAVLTQPGFAAKLRRFEVNTLPDSPAPKTAKIKTR